MYYLIGFMFGAAAHQTDRFIVRLDQGTVWPMVLRYIVGVLATLPIFLLIRRSLRQKGEDGETAAQRDTLAYMQAFASVGTGVVAGHTFDHIIDGPD